jgi:hypothetical protein
MEKRNHHTKRYCGNRVVVIRNPVFSIGRATPCSMACWIPGSAFSRPGMTALLFRLNIKRSHLSKREFIKQGLKCLSPFFNSVWSRLAKFSPVQFEQQTEVSIYTSSLKLPHQKEFPCC